MQNAIIIGAGPAGLTAAYELLKKTNIHPIILEATDTIGGISQTVEHNGNRMDIGGHRFFSKDQRVLDLWDEMMPMQGKPSKDDILLNRVKKLAENGPDPEVEDRVMLLRSRVSRIYFLRKFFDYPVSLKFQTFANMGLGRTIKAGFGYVHSAIFKKKEDSLENFYINRFGKPLYQMFFEDYTAKVWGVHPSKISADWGSQRVKGLSLSKAVLNVLKKPFVHDKSKQETSLIEQFSYPKMGPGQLYNIMAEEVVRLGGEIIMNACVDQVTINGDEIKSVTTFVDGKYTEFTADYFISTMAIKDLIEAIGKIKVPEDVYHVATHLPYRDFMTVGLLLDKLKIKNTTKIKTLNNIVPDCWIYVQDREVKLGRIQIFNNWSPYMVSDIENKVWIGLEYFCNEGDEMWNANDKDFINMAIEELIKIDVIDSKDDVLDSTRVKIKKAYPAYFGEYANFDVVKNYLNTFDNLYCIGRNGQHRYNNMDHSMASAMEAVKIINSGIKDKTSIWNVNTEKAYHEEKSEKNEQ